MDDLQFGTRDKRGNWRPSKKLTTGPLFELPPNLKKILAWLPGYFVPWNALFFGLAAAFWFWLTPAKETMKRWPRAGSRFFSSATWRWCSFCTDCSS